MSVKLRLLVPEATTNYILNPQLRYDTTGWTAAGSTISRNMDYARFGIASLKVITTGSVINEGAFYRVSSLQGVTDLVTVSAYVRGSGRVRIRLIDNPFGKQYSSQPISLTPNRWQRIFVTGLVSGTAAGNDLRLYVESAYTTAKAITFYVDGAQMERKPYPTSYCDGDQEGCRWNVANSASLSTRTADTRAGGRWVDLTEQEDLYVTVVGGLGMAPLTNQIQSFALSAGSFYQGYKVGNRVVTFSFHAKTKNLLRSSIPLAHLHELRQQLIDIIKPDKTIGGEAFWLEYSDEDADRPLYCRFRYEAGLEGEFDRRNGWINSFPVRLIAVDPYWTEDNQEVKQLNIKTSVPSTSSYGWYLKDGIWTQIADSNGNILNGTISNFSEAPDGTIYITGSFTLGGVAYGMCKWDGKTFTPIGTFTGGLPNLVAFGFDGTVYVSGDFTRINGVLYSYIAKYNPVTSTWSAMGTGVNNIVTAICVATNGQVYVGGVFTTAGGVNCYRIARWDGLQWRTVGATSGFNDSVYGLAKSLDGNTIYVCGDFTASNGGGVTYNRVASIDTSTNLISAMGYGLNARTYGIIVGVSGEVYVCGLFSASGSPGTASLIKVAKYSGGSSWAPLGGGINSGTVSFIKSGKNGEIYAGGAFTTASSQLTYYFAKWNNSEWYSMEFPSVVPPTTFGIQVVFISKNGTIFAGVDVSAGLTYVATNSVSYTGSSEVFPKMYIKGQARLNLVQNAKTGSEIYFNLFVFSNEEIDIDFARGTIISSVRGSLISTIEVGSELKAMKILPGENTFNVSAINEVTPVTQLRWTPRHWSVDAVVDAEAL